MGLVKEPSTWKEAVSQDAEANNGWDYKFLGYLPLDLRKVSQSQFMFINPFILITMIRRPTGSCPRRAISLAPAATPNLSLVSCWTASNKMYVLSLY